MACDEKMLVPGLNTALKVEDLHKSCLIYRALPDDSKQADVDYRHIQRIAELVVRYGAEKIFGVHLIHSHFTIPLKTIMLGVNYNNPQSRWTKPTAIQSIELNDIHGHIFIFSTNTSNYHPYEFQAGPRPDMSGIRSGFLDALGTYLTANRLTNLIGLQIIDQSQPSMAEVLLRDSTMMFNVSQLKDCKPSTQTGWKFEVQDGKPRVCTAGESHGVDEKGEKVCYNAGSPHPEPDSFKDVTKTLVRRGVLVSTF